LVTIPHPRDIVVSFLKKNKFIVLKDVTFYEDHFSFPPAIIVSTIAKPCITPPVVPLLNLGATPPQLAYYG
jgi:hypothetical protein